MLLSTRHIAVSQPPHRVTGAFYQPQQLPKEARLGLVTCKDKAWPVDASIPHTYRCLTAAQGGMRPAAFYQPHRLPKEARQGLLIPWTDEAWPVDASIPDTHRCLTTEQGERWTADSQPQQLHEAARQGLAIHAKTRHERCMALSTARRPLASLDAGSTAHWPQPCRVALDGCHRFRPSHSKTRPCCYVEESDNGVEKRRKRGLTMLTAS